MDRLIYTAMSGASQILAQQAVSANNLANAATVGFKRQLAAFRAVPVNGGGLATRTATAMTTAGADFAGGTVEHTGRSLDVALDGAGWLAVQDVRGAEAYTRDGNLQPDASGLLRSGGRPVLSRGGEPIVLPLDATYSISSDGTISALAGGSTPDTLTPVAQLKLASQRSEGMQLGEDGLFRPPEGTGGALAADARVHVRPEALEGSNVSATEAMVSMISNAREFDMNMKAISLADDSAQAADKLLDPS